MRGDVWHCPRCGYQIIEVDCVYIEAWCTRTLACRPGTRMLNREEVSRNETDG